MTDRIPVRYLPTEEAQPALGEYRTDDTTPVVHGGTGATTPEDARTNLGIVDAPGSVTEFPYTMEIPPNTTPASGEVSRDNADPTLVTKLFFHKLDSNGVDQTTFLAAIKARDWVNLNLGSDPNVYEQYDATGAATLSSDVYTVPVVYYGQQGAALADGDAVEAYWRIASDPVDWGEITGTLPDQTDLQAELDAKAAATHASTHAEGGADELTPAALGVPDSSDDSVTDIVTVTQAEYDAIPTPTSTTLYLICEDTP